MIAKLIKAKIEDRKNDFSVLNDANRFRLPSASDYKITMEVLKEKILNIFNDMYFYGQEKGKNPKSKKQCILNPYNLLIYFYLII